MQAISPQRLLGSLILVADDVELNRKMLLGCLQSKGYTNIVLAEDGAQALQMTHELKPDLVILDLMMPNMDGYGYCEAIRRDRAYDNMPILVQTALDEMANKLRAFDLGASDYICKPLDPRELNARTQIHLTQKFLVEDLQHYQQRTTEELEAAKQMQLRLMPSEHQQLMYERVFEISSANYFETSSQLGGDGWGMRALSETRLAVWIYDFSGHGMGAAMNVFRLHTIMQDCLPAGAEPGHFLSTVNRHLHPLLERHEFATMFYGIIDTEANCLLYASAAVQPALLLTENAHEPYMLNGRGFPLGALAHAAYDTNYIPFGGGSLLLLHSDGLTETPNTKNEYIGLEQIKSLMIASLQEDPHHPAHKLIDRLTGCFKAHTPLPLEDDLTLCAFWRRPKNDAR